MIIAVDFDGTLCKDEYPDIGDPNEELIEALINAQKQGHKLILSTCRTGQLLDEAVDWCGIVHDMHFEAVNDNLPELVDTYNNNCRKISADLYIDDKSISILDFIQNFNSETNTVMTAHKEICDSIHKLYRRKNHDYGNSFHEARTAVPYYTLGKLYDKFKRLMTLMTKNSDRRLVKDETVEDTLLDLANYAIMELAERRAEK